MVEDVPYAIACGSIWRLLETFSKQSKYINKQLEPCQARGCQNWQRSAALGTPQRPGKFKGGVGQTGPALGDNLTQ